MLNYVNETPKINEQITQQSAFLNENDILSKPNDLIHHQIYEGRSFLKQNFSPNSKLMTIFLRNHTKIEEFEFRLNKNQYLSNECLPNFIDALVFRAIKASNQIPKRETHPNFYHWYILMRQFAERTLDYWLKDLDVQGMDYDIKELVSAISMEEDKENQKPKVKETQKIQLFSKLSEKFVFGTPEKKQKFDPSLLSKICHRKLERLSKPNLNQGEHHDESVTEYLMSIKVNRLEKSDLKNIKSFFDVKSVNLRLIRILSESSHREKDFFVLVSFETSNSICEQLKNTILRYANVQNIQCKKQRRSQRP